MKPESFFSFRFGIVTRSNSSLRHRLALHFRANFSQLIQVKFRHVYFCVSNHPKLAELLARLCVSFILISALNLCAPACALVLHCCLPDSTDLDSPKSVCYPWGFVHSSSILTDKRTPSLLFDSSFAFALSFRRAVDLRRYATLTGITIQSKSFCSKPPRDLDGAHVVAQTHAHKGFSVENFTPPLSWSAYTPVLTTGVLVKPLRRFHCFSLCTKFGYWLR